MNNYFNYQNLYNAINNFSNKINTSKTNLYEPYQGFIRGNMFENLYDPYKATEPYKISPANEQAELLTNIDVLAFAAHDINLYLDVCPDDKEMIELYNKYNEDRNMFLEQYQNKYGPLLVNSESLNTFPWAWNNSPWPWDGR